MDGSLFIGRERQLARLRTFGAHGSGKRLTAIYGRRRVGKTRLVQEAYPELRLLDFEGVEGGGSGQQRLHFRSTLYRHSRLDAHRMATTDEWTNLLMLLFEWVGDGPCVILFDELQWMAADRSELVSKLKYAWDNFVPAHAQVHLILCGSVSSFLVKKVIRSRALYGRIDEVMDLRPLPFGEVAASFFHRRSTREALEYYLAFGGVPKYLELYDDRHSVRLNLARLCFEPEAYFLNETERLFVSHFGKTRHYRRIVKLLADKGFASRPQLGRMLRLGSGGRLSELLDNLCLAGFIEGYSPIHKPASNYLQRFRIADPYLRFYHRFIRPLRRRIERSGEAVPLHQALPDRRYEVFLGLAFEHFCYQHAAQIARVLGFSAVAYDYGSWFRKADLLTGAQIDLLFKRADRVLTLCEVKFRERVSVEVIAEVQRKVEALAPLGMSSIEKVLISALPPDPAVYDAGYFAQILTAADLAHVYKTPVAGRY